MNRAVMISINPKWVGLIASGQKTVEVRKMRPKIDVPFKCYIYETQGRKWQNKNEPQMQEGKGRVVGEFVCDKLFPIFSFSGSRFWLNETLVKETMLANGEIIRYAGAAKEIYGWHISNLKMYEKPKELKEFRLWNRPECAYGDLGYATPKSCDGCNNPPCHVQRALQSWGYVEELK